MILRIGNFLFGYRNVIFPLVYVLLFINSPPLLPDYRASAVLGFLVALGGQLLRAATIGLEYIVRGGRRRRVYAESLVEGGVFAHCRNPLYVGNFVILLGLGIASNSIIFLGVGLPCFAFAYWAIIVAEEDYLRRRFGTQFEEYCSRVNRLIPDFSGITVTLQGMKFNWRRLITAEYGSTYCWLGGMCLVVLKNVWMHGDYHVQRPLVLTLWIGFGLGTLAYGVARYLKKGGFLRDSSRS